MPYLKWAWACHMLAVLLAAYILARIVRRRWLAVILACAFGVVFAWTLMSVDATLAGRFRIYWRFVASVAWPLEEISMPRDYVRAMLFCWIAPIVIAWLTVRGRTRPRPDDSSSLE